MEIKKDKQDIETLCVQAGYNPKSGEPRVVPVAQSTTYKYDNADLLADLFDLKTTGHFYTRISNPTVAALEEKVTALEGGVGSLAAASGQAAIFAAVLNVCSAGDNIVVARQIYGGTHNLFNVTLKRFGIEARFFDTDNIGQIDKLTDGKTKLIFVESIPNPSIAICDFDKIAEIARKHKVLFFVDNTLATAALFRPFEHGADIIVYSSSKYLDGHAVALGGIIVDSGNFKFKGNARYPEFNTPDASYNNIVYADKFGKAAYITKARVQIMRDLGAVISPQNAFLTMLGCETLALRMKKHSENAKAVAEFLKGHSQVEWVNHSSLKDNKYHLVAKKYFKNGTGGIMAFGIKGGTKAAKQFMKSLKLIAIVTHLADIRTSVIHPASTTHRQLTADELKKSGVPDNLIRLSVGIENADDLIADLKQALDKNE